MAPMKTILPDASLTPTRAFVVQLRDSTLDRESLIGRVEHVVSGEAAYFTSMAELAEFMDQVIHRGEAHDCE